LRVIEMHTGDDDQIGDDEGYSSYSRERAGLVAMMLSAPSLAIASLVIGFASLSAFRAADLIGETALITSKSKNLSQLTELRAIAYVQVIAAIVALALAIAAGLRVHGLVADDDAVDDNLADPTWIRALVGAALIVAVLAVIAGAGTLIYTVHAHASKQNLFGG
jgi:hypothetical protein